nr:TraI/MobA(P) family conjugative relaxase [Variovorax sp. SRS16]
MKDPKKSSFAGLSRYITDSQGKAERLGEVRLTNFASDAVDWAVREAEALQAHNTRAQSDKTYHLLISFAPGESPAPEALRVIEDRICTALGYQEHQRISAVHRDTDCLHIHVAINKIHPKRHTIHEPLRDFKLMGEAAAKLEVEFGLQRLDHAGRKSQSENRADDLERHSGVQSLLAWIKAECLGEFRCAKSWHELHATMRSAGLALRLQGNGLVIEDDKGCSVKASSVAREMSKAQLEKKLGPFTPSSDKGAQIRQPAKRYEAKPIRSRLDTSRLYEAYKAEQDAMAVTRSEATRLERSRYTQEVEAAKRAGRLRRATIKLMGDSPANKRLLYLLSSRKLKDDLQKARNHNVLARQRIANENTQRAWADWLRLKAANGHKDALEALRAREASRGLRGNTVAGEGIRNGPETRMLVQDSVTKQGTVIYRAVGNATVRDDGKRIQLESGSRASAMAQALRLAAHRYGTRISLTGTADFKELAVRAAAAARLPITFADAALEQRRIALIQFLNQRERNDERTQRQRQRRPGTGDGRAGRSAPPRERSTRGFRGALGELMATGAYWLGSPSRIGKPNIGRAGTRPPPTNQKRLRNLHQLAVVRIASGSEVLLPRDVPDHVEQRHPGPDHHVRRPVDRPGVAVGAPKSTSATAAVDMFVAERDSKRLKGIDIPKYIRYTDDFGAAALYAGTRRSAGATLALVKRGDVVAVLEIDAATARRLKRIKVGDPVSLTPDGAIRIKGIKAIKGRSR